MIIFNNKMSSWDKSAFYSRSHAGGSIMLGKWALIKLEFLSPWRCGRQLCPDQTVLWSWVSREKLNTLMQCIYLHLCFKCQDGILWKVEKRQWKWGEGKESYQKWIESISGIAKAFEQDEVIFVELRKYWKNESNKYPLLQVHSKLFKSK